MREIQPCIGTKPSISLEGTRLERAHSQFTGSGPPCNPHLHIDGMRLADSMSAPVGTTAQSLSDRIERLPFTRWHARRMSVVGTAHFFDGFDAMTIAFVLPLLVMEWGLTPSAVAVAIASGYAGQMVGAVLFGQAAERYGRLPTLRLAIAILSVFSLLSSFATSFAAFVAFRLVQGLGLGGETPIAATYLNEISPARLRGRMVFTLQTTFAFGVLSTAIAAIWLIPHFGWRAMFIVGSAPLLLAIFLPKLLGESPRWLAHRGRFEEANSIVEEIERSASQDTAAPAIATTAPETAVSSPEPAGLRTLLSDGYAPRTITLWMIAFCIAIAGFGVTTWMPTLYKTVYHLPIEQVLRYGLATIFASFVGALAAIPLIDVIGRKWCFSAGFAGGGAALLYLSQTAGTADAFQVMILAAIANAFLAFILAGIYVYAPEIYPTRMRAIGAGAASAWLRAGAIVGPVLVGVLLPGFGIEGVFLLLGGVAIAGGIITAAFAIETKGKPLDQIAT